MATLHLRFVRWAPEARRYQPVPDGTRVLLRDQDALSPDDDLSRGTTRDGQVALELTGADEACPDLYWVVQEPDGDRWDTRFRVAEDGTPGLLPDFAPRDLGSPEAPVVFRRSLDLHLCLRRWRPEVGWVPLEAGVAVEAVEHDELGPLGELLGTRDVLARGETDEHGRVTLQIFELEERRPDLSFRIPEAEAHGLPAGWTSEEAAELVDPGRLGYWRDLHAAGLGEPDFPLCFGVGPRSGLLHEGNLAAPVVDGVALLEELEAAFSAARHTLHIQMMLFFDDEMGRRVADGILACADRGVTVRLLVDVGTTSRIHNLVHAERFWVRHLRTLDEAERQRLLERYDALAEEEAARGQVEDLMARLAEHPNITLCDSSFELVEVLPELPEDLPSAYLRLEASLPWLTTARVDHRKLVIVDGRLGLLGGQNIGREYIYEEPFDPELTAEEEPWHKWHDTALRLEGPVVRELQLLFRERWVTEGGDEFEVAGPDRQRDPAHPTFPLLERREGGCRVRILRTTPGAVEEFHHAFLAAVRSAERRVLVQTPYFSSREVVEAVKEAAGRGVHVVMVFPDSHNDSVDFLYAARLVYAELIEAGVEVYEYRGRMNHSKLAVIDDSAWVGSANLNHASFFKHYEVVAVVEDLDFTESFEEALFGVDLPRSRRIALEEVPELLDINGIARTYLRQVVWRLY